ncbi:MAG: TIGR02587 family membrane protein [Pseudomonadota bacterium]|jgi:putative integral membrane protein TIGR02587|nr:MAG: TIGR02587 family membrane protein [Pseudomonadota bacterium]
MPRPRRERGRSAGAAPVGRSPSGTGSAERISAARRRFLTGLARAYAGALIFALPMLMTMELWWIGFYADPLRLAVLTAATIPILAGLSSFVGFESTTGWRDDLKDACIAYGIGWTASALILLLFGVITSMTPVETLFGQIAIQAVPAGIGATLARSQLGSRGERQEEERRKEQASYGGELFLMGVGAIFLALNVAPTEEVVLIAHQMTLRHTLALVALSLLIMHGFVFAVEFQGSHSLPPGTPFWSAFLRFTVAGYALALVMSAFILWTFGRAEGVALEPFLQTIVVLGFPAAIGAAAARLIL